MPIRRSLALVAGALLLACSSNTTNSDAGTSSDAGTVDAGASDAGTQDGGASDGGDTDGGSADAAVTPLPVAIPTAANWTFLGPANGGPNEVFGASFDQGGNLWVAGGEQGLYLLRPGETTYQQFTMADGLRPYGYMADGTTPPGDKYLKVISVSGAWAGTVFVGYQGKPPAPGEVDCESNWDGANPDPAIYKSGDADRVTLNGTGISVVHYDIFSGPGIVGGELRGREKLCNVLRIRYDEANDKVWFGANHGFAMGDAHYDGNANCEWATTPIATPPTQKTDPFSNAYGHKGCNGLLEHVHPALNALRKDGSCCAYLTGDYWGVALDRTTGDVWFGGVARTTRFRYGSTGGNYFDAQSQTEDPGYISNRIDIWPDKVQEPDYPAVGDRTDDLVSGAAAMSDGSVWVTSFVHGLAHLGHDGQVNARLDAGDGLVASKLSAVVTDPADESIWVGPNFGGGLTRVHGGTMTQYDYHLFGFDLANQGVSDLQSFGSGSNRKIVVSFAGDRSHAGVVGLYTGP